MEYVGLQSQIWKNNTKSTLMLFGFPALILGLTYLFFVITNQMNPDIQMDVNQEFLTTAPIVIIIVGIWFLIAYTAHTGIINMATSAKPLERRENKYVYNLVENLCISVGMKTPKINIIEDDSLNAYASGINDKTYSIALSRGIIEKLDEEELKGVIAHELTHIRNRDVRLLIISIVFVGIFALISEMLLRSVRYGSFSSRRSSSKDRGNQWVIIVLVLALIGWLTAVLFKFAISRKREFLADAGAVEMTKNSRAMASALRKVSGDPRIEAVENKDVAQMFIENPQLKKSSIFSMFATHPPIEERIKFLEQL